LLRDASQRPIGYHFLPDGARSEAGYMQTKEGKVLDQFIYAILRDGATS
jgi:hypothetical protein